MRDALARSVAETAADALAARAAGAGIADEAIGLYLWFERGTRDQADLVTLINLTREILDRRERVTMRPANDTQTRPSRCKPLQLSLDLGAA